MNGKLKSGPVSLLLFDQIFLAIIRWKVIYNKLALKTAQILTFKI